MSAADWYRKHLTPQQPQQQRPQFPNLPPTQPPPLVQGPAPAPVQFQPGHQEMQPQAYPVNNGVPVQHWDGTVSSETRLKQAIAANAVGVGEGTRDGHIQTCEQCGEEAMMVGLPRDLTGVPSGAVIFSSNHGGRIEPSGRCTNCGWNGRFRQGRPENYVN